MHVFRLSVILLIVLGCTGSSQFPSTDVYTLKQYKQLIINDTLLSNASYCIQEVEDKGRSYLMFSKQLKLILYDITSNKVISTISLPEDKNLKPNAFSCVFINPDSIYVIPFMHQKVNSVLLIDSQGNLKREITSHKVNNFNQAQISCIFCNGNLPMYYQHQLFLPNRSTYSAATTQYYDMLHAFQIKIDLQTGEYKLMEGKYPDVYRGKLWNREYFADVDREGRLIMSFASSSKLVVKDAKSGQEKLIDAHSKFFDKVKPLDSWEDWEVKKTYHLQEAYYQFVVHDKYRQLYYRFAFLPTNWGDKQKKEDYDKPFSIIILDKDFQIVGETKFKDSSYVNGAFFIGKAGLYLLDRKTFLGESSEKGIYSFHIFRLEKR